MIRRLTSYAKPIILAILVYVCLGIAVPQQANGAATSRYLSVPGRKQEKSNWCWAASQQSVINYTKGLYPTQCGMVSYWYPGCPNYQNHISNVSYYLSGQYGISNKYYASPLQWSGVKETLNLYRPAIARWAWATGGGHMVTIYGYYEDSGISRVSYINPITGYKNSMSYGDFRWNADWQWTHSVTHIQG